MRPPLVPPLPSSATILLCLLRHEYSPHIRSCKFSIASVSRARFQIVFPNIISKRDRQQTRVDLNRMYTFDSPYSISHCVPFILKEECLLFIIEYSSASLDRSCLFSILFFLSFLFSSLLFFLLSFEFQKEKKKQRKRKERNVDRIFTRTKSDTQGINQCRFSRAFTDLENSWHERRSPAMEYN